MTWAKFDDRYDDNRKIKRAWRRHPRAVGLHAMAVTYSSRHETDGLIDIDWLEEKLPKPAEREQVVKALVECGLFDPVDGELFRVHDYMDFNPSREQLESKRKRDAARKRLQTDSERNPNGIHAESGRVSNGNPSGASRALPQASPAGVSRSPSRPVPSRPGEDEG